MTCPHCKAQWQLPAGSNKIIKKCPFCDGDLYACVDNSYTAGMVLKEIISRFGISILSNSSELIFAFSSVAPHLEKEKQGLLLFEACNGISEILNLQEGKQEKIDVVFITQIKKMTDIITEICGGFFDALGMPVNIDAVDEDENEISAPNAEWEYVNLGNDTIEIIACKGQLPSEVIFPSCIDGKKVISIGSTVFGAGKTKGADRLRVESVVIPQGITSIGSGVFSGCKALKSISLPTGLSSIGDEAFKNCKVLTSVAIPDSVTHIGSGAFAGSGIRSAVWPGNIEVVSKEAFKNCKQLLSVSILDGVLTIQQEAFCGCTSLGSVTLPNSVTTIETAAFSECKKLSSMVLPDTIEHIGKAAFKYCSSLSTINIPKQIKTLEYAVFYGCGFSSFIVPDHITKIDDDAFGNCWSLTKITIPSSVVEIDDDALFNTLINARVACIQNSTAHKWAQKNKIKFELIQ